MSLLSPCGSIGDGNEQKCLTVYRLYAWEDVEQGAPFDPDFLKKYEGQSKSVKLDASGHEAVQLKAIVVD